MRSLLVTGGAGFIGSNFVRYWRAAHPGDRVVVLDLLTYAGSEANLDGLTDVAFVHGDIGDRRLVATILREAAVDTIVNFAAESHVDRSIAGPAAFLETNVLGTQALLDAARDVWAAGGAGPGAGAVRRFHHVSTDEVYGSLGPRDPPFNELSPFAPNSPYAASKAASDHLVRAYQRTFGLPATISHCSNNYGPRQYPEKLIPLFVLNALSGRPLPIYGDGLNRRDWLHVDDHYRGIERILQNGRVGEHYAIGGGCELANTDIVETLCRALDAAFADDPALARRYPDAPPARGRPTGGLKRFVADRLGHDRRYAVDDRKIRRELGYEPDGEFAMRFADTVRWYLDHPDWWRPILARAARFPAAGPAPRAPIPVHAIGA